MSFLIIAACAAAVIFFAAKYYRQRQTIRQLAGSLANRVSILPDSDAFRGGDRDWRRFLDELNRLLQDLGRLDRQSSGRLSQIETTLGSLQEGVLIIDRDNYVLLVNRALGEMLPSMVAEVGARLESGARSPDFLEFVRDAKKGRGPGRREISVTAQGQEKWFEATAARLAEPPEGAGPWYLFVLHDISKLKRLEATRRQFVANASHELKTPVSVIKGYTETLVADHATMDMPDRERFLRTIHRHAERLALLINDLLSLSRLESDSLSFDWTESDVLAWVRETVAEYRSGYGGQGFSFELEFAASDGVVARFDAMKLRQVFDNLVGNAVKYSPSGGVVRVGVDVKDGLATLWVQDQGKGVPPDDLERIFERFYRVDKGRARETGGTGLGLSIVKHIVEGHEGRVWAENLASGGFRVSFTLPLVARRVAEPQ